MQISIRTSSAILLSKVLTVSSFLILKDLVDVVDAENNKLFLVLACMWVFDEVDNSKQSITPSTKWDQVKVKCLSRCSVSPQFLSGKSNGTVIMLINDKSFL